MKKFRVFSKLNAAITNFDLDRMASLYVQEFNAKPWNERWSFEGARAELFNTLKKGNVKVFFVVDDTEKNNDNFMVGFAVGCRLPEGGEFRLTEIVFDRSIENQVEMYSPLIEHLEKYVREEFYSQLVIPCHFMCFRSTFLFRRCYERLVDRSPREDCGNVIELWTYYCKR